MYVFLPKTEMRRSSISLHTVLLTKLWKKGVLMSMLQPFNALFSGNLGLIFFYFSSRSRQSTCFGVSIILFIFFIPPPIVWYSSYLDIRCRTFQKHVQTNFFSSLYMPSSSSSSVLFQVSQMSLPCILVRYSSQFCFSFIDFFFLSLCGAQVVI